MAAHACSCIAHVGSRLGGITYAFGAPCMCIIWLSWVAYVLLWVAWAWHGLGVGYGIVDGVSYGLGPQHVCIVLHYYVCLCLCSQTRRCGAGAQEPWDAPYRRANVGYNELLNAFQHAVSVLQSSLTLHDAIPTLQSHAVAFLVAIQLILVLNP